MKTMTASTATTGTTRLTVSCRQSRTYAAAGSARNVVELTMVPSSESATTQPGKLRPPTK
jgi:hypothetical protein